jgi:hypothetical protein
MQCMAAASTHRSSERSAGVLLRFSPEDREELKRLAHAQGLTLQDYADLRLLGREPQPRSGGRPRNAKPDEALFGMTG